MTWREVDSIRFAWIPAADNQAPRIGIRIDLANQTRNLIDAVTLGVMSAKRAPKITINGAEVSCLSTEAARMFVIGPFLPDVNAPGAEISFIRIARQKPEQLFRDPAKGDSLGCHNRKAGA